MRVYLVKLLGIAALPSVISSWHCLPTPLHRPPAMRPHDPSHPLPQIVLPSFIGPIQPHAFHPPFYCLDRFEQAMERRSSRYDSGIHPADVQMGQGRGEERDERIEDVAFGAEGEGRASQAELLDCPGWNREVGEEGRQGCGVREGT